MMFLSQNHLSARERGAGFEKETLLLITLELQSGLPQGREPGCAVFVKDLGP